MPLFLTMTNRCLLFIILLIGVSQSATAQNKVEGKIYNSTSDTTLNGVTIRNKKLRITATSNKEGFYHIFADEGDTLIFSSAGFIPDTINVQLHMLYTAYDVTLERKIITLEMVRVSSTYSQDSLDRRNYYADIFNNKGGITGGNRPTSGFGVSISPFSYFSSAARRKRELKKRLLKEEKDDYIDRSFPKEWVQRLTSLQGDSLNLFMFTYRPSYDFCRKTGRDEMLVYINDKLKEFKKTKNAGNKKSF